MGNECAKGCTWLGYILLGLESALSPLPPLTSSSSFVFALQVTAAAAVAAVTAAAIADRQQEEGI